jgi:hypothetical protein
MNTTPTQLGHAAGAAAAGAMGAKWNEEALVKIQEFANANPNGFLAVKAREWAVENGLKSPAEPRAWGGAMKNAQSKKLITVVGRQQPRHMHGTYAAIWAPA